MAELTIFFIITFVVTFIWLYPYKILLNFLTKRQEEFEEERKKKAELEELSPFQKGVEEGLKEELSKDPSLNSSQSPEN